MAATIGEDADIRVLRFTETDVFEESIVRVFEFAGTMTDAEIETFIDDYQQVTNTGITNVSVTDQRTVTGHRTAAVNATLPLLSAYLQLNFTAPNPVNPSKPNRKTPKLRAVVSGAYQLTGDPIAGIVPDPAAAGSTVLAALNRITGKLEDYSVFRPSETDPIELGGFTYVGGQLVTENRVIDGDDQS
jgi:hypothetical protein